MKLNIGCGNKLLAGYTNIDLVSRGSIGRKPAKAAKRPDIEADARSVPLPDGCADEVLAVHIFEHFYYWDAVPAIFYGERVNTHIWTALEEWHRLLKPGGLLAVEMPDIGKCAANVAAQVARGEALDEHPYDINRLKQGVQIGMWGVYGDPRHLDPMMGHRWGWNFRTLAPHVRAMGFAKVREVPTHFHGTGRTKRDFRLEAIKA